MPSNDPLQKLTPKLPTWLGAPLGSALGNVPSAGVVPPSDVYGALGSDGSGTGRKDVIAALIGSLVPAIGATLLAGSTKYPSVPDLSKVASEQYQRARSNVMTGMKKGFRDVSEEAQAAGLRGSALADLMSRQYRATGDTLEKLDTAIAQQILNAIAAEDQMRYQQEMAKAQAKARAKAGILETIARAAPFVLSLIP